MVPERKQVSDNRRTLFDWVVFLLIYTLLVGGISVAAWWVYGAQLGVWVAVSAAIAGLAALYLFHVETPGETFMKVVLAVICSANAGYLAYNGVRAAGVESFNSAQVRKYEAGMAAAARASSKAIARQIGMSAREATPLDRMFGDDVAVNAALLAFLELASAMVIFAVASRRQPVAQAGVGKRESGRAGERHTEPLPQYINGEEREGQRPN